MGIMKILLPYKIERLRDLEIVTCHEQVSLEGHEADAMNTHMPFEAELFMDF